VVVEEGAKGCGGELGGAADGAAGGEEAGEGEEEFAVGAKDE
jgi:hypothetical protein